MKRTATISGLCILSTFLLIIWGRCSVLKDEEEPPIPEQPVTLAPPQNLTSNGSIIDVGYNGSPLVVDWNGDGLKDLITGQFDWGYLLLYLNSGTNDAPLFTTYTLLEADGVVISLPYG